MKNRREEALLKSDVSFKDLIYPNKVDESTLIKQYFSDPAPPPSRSRAPLKKGGMADSIYSIRREITPQLIASSPTPESSMLGMGGFG